MLEGFCPKCGDPEADDVRPKVFCASLADCLDDDGVPIEWLADLLQLIYSTPNLDWLLLTKRPENWRRRLNDVLAFLYPEDPGDDCPDFGWWLDQWTNCAEPPANVWIGTTVEDQTRADERIPALLAIPARVRFLSCEPLLGPVDLNTSEKGGPMAPVDWVICGGESGSGARPMHPEWARVLRDDCEEAMVPFFFKQWGEWLPQGQVDADGLKHFTHADPLRIGKKRAGRLLDGVEHSAFPSPAPSSSLSASALKSEGVSA